MKLFENSAKNIVNCILLQINFLLVIVTDNIKCHYLEISKFICLMKMNKQAFCCFIQIRDTCTEEENESDLHPRKRPRCHSGDSIHVTTSSEKSSLSPHIGELFVYLDQSVRNEGILGLTVVKTLVCTFIILHLLYYIQTLIHYLKLL